MGRMAPLGYILLILLGLGLAYVPSSRLQERARLLTRGSNATARVKTVDRTRKGHTMSEGKAAGSCLCGSVRFEIAFPSRFCAHCHCDNCRRAHGAAFVTYIGVPADQFQLTDGEDVLVRYHTDTDATRSFCGRCGSTLLYAGPRWENEVHVALANVDGPVDREPGAHVYVDHAAEWWRVNDDLPRYGGGTGTERKS